MPTYIYNSSQTDGKYHEIHLTTCNHLPKISNRVILGWHVDCKSAIREAERRTGCNDFDGCYYCSRNCHRG